MKTLNEEVNNIINGKGNKSVKVAALIELGLMKNEAELLYKINHHVTHREVFKYTFGVELECIYNKEVVTSAFNREGLQYSIEGYNHSCNNSDFRFKYDGSVHATPSEARRSLTPVEMVTPILSSKGGMNDLRKAVECLNECSPSVNRSTGFHVHIGTNFTETQFVNIFKNYQMLEHIIDTFMAESRRADNNHYCHSLIALNFENCNSVDDVVRVMHHDRYYKVNAMSYGMRRTVEFRQHQGTTDIKKIENWVNFCAKLVQFSKHNTFDRVVCSIDDITFLTKAEKEFFKARANALR